MGQTVSSSNPGRGKTFLLFKTIRTALGPPSLLLNGYRSSFPGIKRPRLRMSGAIPGHLNDFLACTQKTLLYRKTGFLPDGDNTLSKHR